ncbi:pilus assembly protein TadG-related protein [Modestobacter marinus]|uniref:pilus assembly protein TadG-related protein n=1 Tax=Modestobacter marinus TaxID=477641 RepID=UPI001C977AF9|nr:pilus assembly protein TadG-related protein [Modestobacter marinus]
MQRLIRRVRGERGAAAVVLSLLMVPMLGFAAVAVDVGALYAERARLQVAADAAALAVAQDCARGACGDMVATASAMVAANAGDASAAPPVLQTGPLRVTVDGSTPVQHFFAPVLGYDSTAVSASATVAWGAPGAGTAVLPLTFSYCSFSQQVGGLSGTTPSTVLFTKTDGTGCTGPSGNAVPGGFAYLDTDPGRCQATSARNQRSPSSTGNSVPSPCSGADFSAWLGKVVLLPLYDDAGQTGNNAWYHVYGYAAFKLTGYYLGSSQYRTSPQPCTGNARCVAGHFVRYVDLSDRFTYTSDGPDTGASILRLIR